MKLPSNWDFIQDNIPPEKLAKNWNAFYWSIYIPTPLLIFSLNFVDLIILALLDGDFFYKLGVFARPRQNVY
jgi:hypothetical protein